MSANQLRSRDPRVERALAELEGIIRGRYPDASFEVEHGRDDPRAIHLVATVDVEDRDNVVDLVIDRMMQIQIDEGLPIFVIPVRPPERVAAFRQAAPRNSTGALEPPATPATPPEP